MRRANLDLDLLCCALPDQQVVFSLQIIRDGFIHVIAGDTQRARIDDAGKRDDSDVGRAAADVHQDRKSTRLNSSLSQISYAVFCLKKKKTSSIALPASTTPPPLCSIRPSPI